MREGTFFVSWVFLVGHVVLDTLLNKLPVPVSSSDSELLAKGYHEQEHSDAKDWNSGGLSETSLETLIGEPGGDGVAHTETHAVSDDNKRNHGFRSHFPIAINSVIDGTETSKHAEASSDTKTHDQSKPVDAMGSANTPENETSGAHDHIECQEPESIVTPVTWCWIA